MIKTIRVRISCFFDVIINKICAKISKYIKTKERLRDTGSHDRRC
jgi:hypothetical protein